MERNVLILWATAKVIEDARHDLHISQVQLADFTRLARSFISGVECGVNGLSLDAFVQLAEVLHVDAPELLRRVMES